MSEQKIRALVVDDEPQIRRLLRTSLGGHNFHVSEAATGAEVAERTASDHPDVILLDLGLPDMDGLEVIRQLREWSDTPIIVLSVRGHEADKVQALDRGADDYVTKPFGISELLARIRATLRHRVQAQVPEPVFTTGDLKMDLVRRLVTVEGHEVKLTPTEYNLLAALVANAGKVVTHQQLLREVWGPSYLNETHYLRVYIGQLRQKIEKEPSRPRHILTEAGVGYRLHYPEES